MSKIVPVLRNYLGKGENPRLILTLGANGPGWDPYRIDYGSSGNVPYSDDENKDWSTWKVTDETGKYYGTITLRSDGRTIRWVRYTPGEEGYYLEGIEVNNPSGVMSVKRIFWKGPFPDTPQAKPATYTDTTRPITLSVKGPDIVDDYGRKVTLKGLVRPSLEWDRHGQYLSEKDFANMATWNGNVLRLDLNQEFWLNSEPATVKGSYKQIVDAMIYHATQNNMAVILDLHWPLETTQGHMANQRSLEFWTQVAWDYRNFGTVIFELFNEPHDIDKGTWLNGNTAKGYVGFQQMYDAVRKTGAKNMVLINGSSPYGYDLSFVNEDFGVKGENIIYGVHPYNEKCFPNYNGPEGPLDKNLKYVLGKYPILFTEFGDNRGSHGIDPMPAYRSVMPFIQSNGIHYTGFAWWVEPSNPGFPCLISDWTGKPLNGGIIVHDNMQKNPATKFFNSPTLIQKFFFSAEQIGDELLDEADELVDEVTDELHKLWK